MSKGTSYKREQIINAAFELTREQGWSAVSARNIAKKMGSSTMPIYSHVNSVDDVQEELRIRARALLKTYQKRPYTEHVLTNMAFGYVLFARDEKNLFRFLYQESPDKLDIETLHSVTGSLLEEYVEDEAVQQALEKYDTSGKYSSLQYNWIFIHGLATLMNAGAFSTYSESEILIMIMDAGAAFFLNNVNR